MITSKHTGHFKQQEKILKKDVQKDNKENKLYGDD
jgi:hypothetical protein